jgi:hypothetical protein
MTKSERRRLIRKIAEIRRRNNQNWMAMMELALDARPTQAKAILRRIAALDGDVRKATQRLAR